ncbi:MAG: DUF448 domain-containing protein [Candidatus Acetothermia bacterium]|jgi:predicted RNA-binding protein YlxR (DUF448 family)|nr:DUF448 domain-containing protein [Candidatus Acetothermia bacterium]MDH7506091.1 DUF448 domain-containing protein [Candidatus Acetothermia bacterium]
MPIRTCVGCRAEREKAELIRLVSHEGRVVVDYHAKLPGRAAYLCPKLACIKEAMKRGRLARALKAEGPLEYGDLPERIAEAIEAQLRALLGLAAKAGKVVSGWNSVRANEKRLALVLVAADASESVRERFAGASQLWLTKEELGRAIGKPPRSLVGLLDGQLAGRIARELERYHGVHAGDRDLLR